MDNYFPDVEYSQTQNEIPIILFMKKKKKQNIQCKDNISELYGNIIKKVHAKDTKKL